MGGTLTFFLSRINMLVLSIIFSVVAITTSSDLVRPSLDGTSLLSKIHTDPTFLMQMFDTADGQELQKVIDLIQELVNEGTSEISSLNDATQAALEKKNNTKQLWDKAAGAEVAAESALTAAREALAKARGVEAEARRIHERESPALEKEVDIFGKVVNILTKLLEGGAKSLINNTEVTAFISVSDQADPAKVQKVLDLLNKLFEASNTDLTKLSDELSTAEKNLKDSIDNEVEAAGALAQAVEATKNTKQDYHEAAGEYTTVKKNGHTRIPVVTNEVATLRSLLSLLIPLRG